MCEKGRDFLFKVVQGTTAPSVLALLLLRVLLLIIHNAGCTVTCMNCLFV
jgi:hypothetical protein